METLAFGLSTAINDGSGKDALAQIQGLWSAASAGMPRTAFVDQVEQELARMQVAVDRHRPADADKAARYLQLIIDSRAAGKRAGRRDGGRDRRVAVGAERWHGGPPGRS
jgi:hypothetical protein